MSIIGIFTFLVGFQGLIFREAYLSMISPLYKLPGGYDSNRSPRDLKPMVTFSCVLGMIIGVCFLFGIINLERFYGSAIPPKDVGEIITMFSIALVMSGIMTFLSYRWEVQTVVEAKDRLFGRTISVQLYKGIAIGSGAVSIIVGTLGLLGVIPLQV